MILGRMAPSKQVLSRRPTELREVSAALRRLAAVAHAGPLRNRPMRCALTAGSLVESHRLKGIEFVTFIGGVALVWSSQLQAERRTLRNSSAANCGGEAEVAKDKLLTPATQF
jgi:hypothetical protein